MEFSYNQKMAIVKLLLDIISVDGKIDARETFYFEKVKTSLGLTSQDHFKVYEYNTLGGHLQSSVGGYPKIAHSLNMKKGRSDTPLS